MNAVVLTGGLVGAVLLVVAEFTTLFEVRTATGSAPIKTVSTGAHHAYALIPIAALAAALACGAFREGNRPALLAVGALGVIALLIALLGDLPDAHANGLIRIGVGRYADASSSPGAGLYLETLGAVGLMISCGLALILAGPPPPPRRAAPRGRRSPRTRSAS